MAAASEHQPPARVRGLTIHAGYTCRRTGACCTSGWRIPVEAMAHASLVEAIESSRLRIGRLGDVDTPGGARVEGPLSAGALLPTADTTAGHASWLGIDDRGRCLFYEIPRGTCAIHRQLGESAMPMSCRQFPRISLTDARGVSVSLSHYCPTAARLLVESSRPLAVVDTPSAFPPERCYEGLDAHGVLPPLVRPGLLHSFDSLDLWERGVVALLARDELSATQALACATAAAERIRDWKPAMGSLEAHVDRALAASVVDAADPGPWSPVTALRLWMVARASVPDSVGAPGPPASAVEGWERHAAAGWGAFGLVVRRYLAARSFGSWLAYQGRGIRTTVAGLAVALGVLQTEVGRACAAARRDLDRVLLTESIRQADLLIVHLVDPAAFASRLGRVEQAAAHAASPLEWLQ